MSETRKIININVNNVCFCYFLYIIEYYNIVSLTTVKKGQFNSL